MFVLVYLREVFMFWMVFRAGVSCLTLGVIYYYILLLLYTILLFILYITIILLYIIILYYIFIHTRIYYILYYYTIYYIIYYTIIHIILLYYTLLLILSSSLSLPLPFFCSISSSVLFYSPPFPSPLPFPIFFSPLPHSKYTCRYLHNLIYIRSHSRISDPACFIGVDGSGV